MEAEAADVEAEAPAPEPKKAKALLKSRMSELKVQCQAVLDTKDRAQFKSIRHEIRLLK